MIEHRRGSKGEGRVCLSPFFVVRQNQGAGSPAELSRYGETLVVSFISWYSELYQHSRMANVGY